MPAFSGSVASPGRAQPCSSGISGSLRADHSLAPLEPRTTRSVGVESVKSQRPRFFSGEATARVQAEADSTSTGVRFERQGSGRRAFAAAIAAALIAPLQPARADVDTEATDEATAEKPSYVPTSDLTIGTKVFLEIAIDGEVIGRLVIGLFDDAVPRSAKNFRELCEGTAGYGYRGTRFYRVVKDYAAQAGDVERDNGTGGYTSFARGDRMAPESLSIAHAGRGIVSMVTEGARKTVGSRFFITLADETNGWADGRYVVVGRVLDGLDVLNALNTVRTATGKNNPVRPVVIWDAGRLTP